MKTHAIPQPHGRAGGARLAAAICLAAALLVAASQARASGMQTPVYVTLAALRQSLGVAVPQEILRQLRPPLWQDQVLRYLFQDRALVYTPFDDKWRIYAATAVVTSGLPRMTRFLLHHFRHGLKRKLAVRYPRLTPSAWRG